MAMARLSVNLLGGFKLAVDGEPIELPTRKARALIALIALDAGRPRPRTKLAAMLWERTPIVEYATEAELAEDGGP